MSRPGIGNRTRASAVGGEHPRKEPIEQIVNACSEHLDMSPRQLHIFETYSNHIPGQEFSKNHKTGKSK
jgi:hypothetical protein